MKNSNNTETKRVPVKLIVLAVIGVLLITGLVFAGREAMRYYKDANVLVEHAEALKTELKAIATHVEKGNYEAANLSVQKIDTLSAEMRAIISEERWKLAADKAPKYGEDLNTAVKFLDVVDEASNTLLKPGIKFLREKGLPSKSTFTKIDPELGKTLNEYADLVDELCPAVEKVLNDFNALPAFEFEKLESKVSKYRVLAKDNAPEIITYLHFLKDTSDGFVRPVAKFLIENGSSLKLDISMDKIGPEMATQLVIFADGIDQLCPLAEKLLTDVNALPAFKIEKVEAKLSKYRKLAKDNEADVLSLMKFAKEISSGVLRPTASVLTRSPLSKLKTESGDIDTKIIREYLSLVDAVRPYVGRANEVLKTNKLLKDHVKQVAKITEKLDSADELFKQYDEYLPYIDVILGDGSDKIYLLVAQNSAEMRSCGGLPASIGTITITDGILHIGDFKPVMQVIPHLNKGVNKIGARENQLFAKNWYGYKLTAATVNPHFPRAAQLIANGYKKKHKKSVNGIISMTPAIVGKLISITGPIKLSNGVKLDEKYSIKYLQRDIYFQYYTKRTIKDAKYRRQQDNKANGLFAEAAKRVINGVMKDIDAKTIMKIIDVVKSASEERIFMMWMADNESEAIVKKLGVSGSLNYEPEKPELGVFFSIKDANRLGFYVDINVKYGKPKTNKNGSVTYPVTVKLKNNIDSESLKKGKGNAYLTSRHDGNMKAMIRFFGPAGGSISSFKDNAKLENKLTKYQNLVVAYCPVFELKPKKTVTFTFNVTTAPGVNAKPKIVTTPLLTKYRHAKAPK